LTNSAFVAIMTCTMARNRRIHFVLMILAAMWCAGFLAAPIVDQLGGNAWFLRRFYGTVCHQIEARSFGIAGFPLAVCVRCSAIYFGFLAGVGLSSLAKTPLHVPWGRNGVLLAGTIVVADVGFDILGVIPNSTVSRYISGGALGVALALLVAPLLSEAISLIMNKHFAVHEGDSVNDGETK
jgi:uncharacterized membrane protein